VKVDQALVQHVARLAQLELGADEAVQLERDLSKIIDYFGALQKAPGTNSRPEALPGVERDDVVRPSLSVEDALGGAPARHDTQFKVPRVIE
jgi:aspartyl-tRNA(Asn)/glutamyl-tRNA(Gln) amidotransferase subunit C